MADRHYTKTELAYKRFDRISKAVLYAILVVTVLLILLFLFSKDDGGKLLFGLLLAADTAFIIFAAAKIGNRRTKYEELLREERSAAPRTGLFREIYEAWRHDELEFQLSYDKLLFEEYHNNTIDMGMMKNGHEFLLTMDEEMISVMVDEETDHPVEMEIPLSELSSLDAFCQKINQVLEAHAGYGCSG